MEFYETVNRRRSIRQFEDREILERIPGGGLKALFGAPPVIVNCFCRAEVGKSARKGGGIHA